MSAPILATKLYIPQPRPKVVFRSRLFERVNEGLQGKLTLISAPAGFGKTTLVSDWAASYQNPIAWLSLDEADNDLTRFLTYFVAALQTITATVGEGVLGVLQSPQPPPTETLLTALLNDIAMIPENFVLVLDDYHVIDSQPVDNALTFLLDYLPPQMHLILTTREDPHLPLSRLRVRGQLNEMRVADLRFTPAETAGFFNQVMGLNLSTEDVAALETRTEGWIAGLQLAAISLQGHQAPASFIKTFTGNHHFVLDYLVEEVLQQQPESVQTFLLHTSILERLCGSLCDAVLLNPSASGQETLEHLERANLFIVPLDNERRWYRYHHLFAELLRQRLQQITTDENGTGINELHRRASLWYEANGLDAEAFQHAVAADDVDHAARLVEGNGMPLFFRGVVAPVLKWLESLPAATLDARPSLWVMNASVLLFASQISGVEQKLQAAEIALEDVDLDDKIRDLIGHIASIRATLAVTQHQIETIVSQSHRALEYLHPHNLPVRTATTWTLGHAYLLQRDLSAARRAYTEAISISEMIGHTIITIMASIGLGNVQELELQPHLAVQNYQRVLQLVGDPPIPIACEAHLGMARSFYEWNDLDAARRHGELSVQLAPQLEMTDRVVGCELFLARLKLVQGDVAGASTILAKAAQFVRQHNYMDRMPEVAAVQVLMLLRQGNLAVATNLAQAHDIPISQARIHLAQGNPSAALALLEPLRQEMESKGWEDERLRIMILQSIALYIHGDKDTALQMVGDALALALPGGLIRIFIDEGLPMAQLLSEAAVYGIMPEYVGKLLAIFDAEAQADQPKTPLSHAPSLIEPLSQRELEVLQLIAQGLSNQEISQRLFLALSTVKGHNQKIFDKLQVQRRTEAIARARDLGLL